MADPSEPPESPAARPFLEFRPLLRAPGIASDARKLILATLGLLALGAGWSALSRSFGGPEPWYAPIPPGREIEALAEVSANAPRGAAWLMTEPFRVVVSPFAALFARRAGPAPWFRSALMAIWAVIVWGIAGGAIARIAVVQAADGRRVGLGSALRFAFGKAASLIGAPLTPMLGVAIFAAACALIGLLNRVPWGIGAIVAALLGFVPLLLGLAMALILVGLAIGWPLMHATVAAEGEDAPDALSRSYSYVNQRLARYAAHTLASWAIGTVGLVVAIGFAWVVVSLADWGTALGAPEPLPSNDLADTVRSSWPRLVGLVVHAWIYSYFWSAASLIYLILRRDVDGTSWHDVSLPEHDLDTFAGDPGAETPRVEMPEAP
jgi:hypothetical protein